MPERYIQPNWFTRNVFNRIVAWLTQLGISVYGSRVLAVKGRKSGMWHTIPVNLLVYQSERYLVAPRGVTQWVRNVRAGSDVELRLGSRHESFKLVEIPHDDPLKIELLRAYLRRWAFEAGVFFEGVDANASDEALRRIAPNHPVFRIERQRA
jgi:hypothetical protein